TEPLVADTIVSRQTKLADEYVPGSYRGNLHVIRAENHRNKGLVFKKDLGWQQYVDGTVHIWPNPGSHMSIFKAPNVIPLAKRVDRILSGAYEPAPSETQ
ncbi:MAG: hypothetical protein AAFX40_02595, partial [Cyanobacteria bacterium J06639_1]